MPIESLLYGWALFCLTSQSELNEGRKRPGTRLGAHTHGWGGADLDLDLPTFDLEPGAHAILHPGIFINQTI